ncbi:MAG: hypothetical protein FWB80_00945, partial [Defluviitaleaceae bacterium]|nr:hypothetical protein [Defluviitaleaceae bacterium]
YHHITVNNVMTGMPPLTPNTEFATVPQRFSIRAATPSRSEILTTFARPVQVVLPVERFTTPEGLSTGLFVNDTNAATWRDTQGALNFATNSLSSTISAPTTFAAITRNTPQATQVAHPSNHAMQRVTSRLTITDMQAFNPNHQVSANEFNNIVNAIVNNRTSVTLGANLSAADTRSLTNARLLAPANLTREDAIDIMVRLYENRTRQILTPMTPAASVPGIQNTSPTTHRNMRVAADLGFITGPLEPQGHINMGELMSMVDIIMQDSGM